MVDFEKIINNHPVIDYEGDSVRNFTKNCIKEAIKQSLPQILKIVADKAQTERVETGKGWFKQGKASHIWQKEYKEIVNKESITSLEQEILKELL